MQDKQVVKSYIRIEDGLKTEALLFDGNNGAEINKFVGMKIDDILPIKTVKVKIEDSFIGISLEEFNSKYKEI